MSEQAWPLHLIKVFKVKVKIIKSNVCDCSLPVQNKTDTGSRVCDNSILIFRLRERGEGDIRENEAKHGGWS